MDLACGGHALDGDKALERGVFGAVDLSHASGAETPGDDEAADGGARRGHPQRSSFRSGHRGRLDLICHGRSAKPNAAILILVAEESQRECEGWDLWEPQWDATSKIFNTGGTGDHVVDPATLELASFVAQLFF